MNGEPDMVQTGTGDGGVVTQTTIKLPGMKTGVLGLAGEDKPGPSVRTVAIAPALYIFQEMVWLYLQTFFGLLAIDGLGLAELAPAGEAFEHLYSISGMALAPTTLGLLKELYDYLGKVRASRL